MAAAVILLSQYILKTLTLRLANVWLPQLMKGRTQPDNRHCADIVVALIFAIIPDAENADAGVAGARVARVYRYAALCKMICTGRLHCGAFAVRSNMR